MTATARPFRSVLYIPGDKPRALDKARSLPVDAIIFDLEDAVSVESKAAARQTLAAALDQGGYGQRFGIVRINGLESDWGSADLDAILPAGPQAVLLPKAETAAQVEAVAERLDAVPACAGTQVWTMMETPRGILNAAEIAAAPRMGGFVMGTNDLAKELRTRFLPDRQPLVTSLQICLLAARAAGIAIVDGVYNAFKDEDGLRRECEQGRDLGFDGKTLIHPAQVPVANEIFAPSQDDIDVARRQIEAFEAAEAEGKGVAVVDGKIVENLHIVTARQTLAKADAIAALES